jgi:hypothetical protein
VAVVARLRQCVGQAGGDPFRAVLGDADAGGDRVGGLEPDAPHVRGQLIRVLRDGLDRLIAVLLVDLHRQRRGHADALQEDHDLLDRLLLGPGVLDPRAPLGAEAVDLDEPVRLVVDDVHDVDAEVIDHAFGHHGADALDHARAQVPPDALLRGGQHRRVGVDLELLAVLDVGGPAAAQPQGLADLGAEQRADRRDQFRRRAYRAAAGAPVRRDPRDRVAGLRVRERDPLEDPLQDRYLARRLLRERGRRHDTIMPRHRRRGGP